MLRKFGLRFARDRLASVRECWGLDLRLGDMRPSRAAWRGAGGCERLLLQEQSPRRLLRDVLWRQARRRPTRRARRPSRLRSGLLPQVHEDSRRSVSVGPVFSGRMFALTSAFRLFAAPQMRRPSRFTPNPAVVSPLGTRRAPLTRRASKESHRFAWRNAARCRTMCSK